MSEMKCEICKQTSTTWTVNQWTAHVANCQKLKREAAREQERQEAAKRTREAATSAADAKRLQKNASKKKSKGG